MKEDIIVKLNTWLFKNVQLQNSQEETPPGVYLYTLSGAVCSAMLWYFLFHSDFKSKMILRRQGVGSAGVYKNIWELLKNVQVQGAQKNTP